MMKSLFYKIILILVLLVTVCELAANCAETIYFYVPKKEVIQHSYGLIDEDREMIDVGIKTLDPVDGNNYSYMIQLYDIDPINTLYRVVPNVDVDTVIIERRLP